MAYTEMQMQLIRRLLSPHNNVAVQAVKELRVRGWLSGGLLERAHLRFAQLLRADLCEANLRGVNLSMANLQWADLSMADLEGARLNRVDLHRADLSGANLQGAFMTKVNLQGARNLTEAQLAQASRLRGATLPDGSRYDGRFNLPGDIKDARILHIDTNDPQAMADFYGVLLEDYLEGLEWVKKHLLIVVETMQDCERVGH